MLTAVAESARVRVMLTLRADFYARCVEDAALAALLAAPGQAALYQMITRPAERATSDHALPQSSERRGGRGV